MQLFINFIGINWIINVVKIECSEHLITQLAAHRCTPIYIKYIKGYLQIESDNWLANKLNKTLKNIGNCWLLKWVIDCNTHAIHNQIMEIIHYNDTEGYEPISNYKDVFDMGSISH